jgi:ferredoxin--NADP+ reductase
MSSSPTPIEQQKNSTSSKYTAETILWIKSWTDHLFSFRLTRHAGFRFIPGQFARLGVKKKDPKQPEGFRIVWRAYSIVSASYDEFLEFYSIVVPGGEFTTELYSLKEGDTVFVEKMNYGFLTTDRFENGQDLWLLSTGTGLAPFLSILMEPSTWETYKNIILVHSVREKKELAYQDWVKELSHHEFFGEFAKKQLKYIRVVTRETIDDCLTHRITQSLDDGSLETAAGVRLDLEKSRIMICGNPDMVDETRKKLASKGFTVSRRGQPGNMAVENYW